MTDTPKAYLSMMLLFITFLCVVCYCECFNIKRIGRWTESGQANWSNSGFEMVTTSPMTVTFNEYVDCNYYVETFVDGISQGRVHISPENKELNIALAGHVKVMKVTEASFIKNGEKAIGIMQIYNISGSGTFSNPDTEISSKSQHKIQVFGDSLSCGYGVLGSMPCDFTPETENAQLAWPTLTANALNAELNQVTWSGKGVVRNHGDILQISEYPLPYYYNRTLGLQEGINSNFPGETWDTSTYDADVVMVLLGSNDYSSEPYPSDEQFIQGFISFVHQIKSDYSRAKIILMCSPDEANTKKCINVASVATLSEVYFMQIGWTPDWDGCANHPSMLQQKYMADTYIIPYMKTLLFAW